MAAVILWWLALQLIGLLALPLTWRLFARLPGRGYPFAKVLGLLLVSYVLWLGASFNLLPNTLGGVIIALTLLGALSAWAGWPGLRRDQNGERPLLAWLRSHRALVLASEGLFLLVLAAWSAFRAFNPDISGTEKPMEFAFINGVLSSRLLPPQDPWLSGYGISYYYFGYVMLAVLIRLTGVLPEIGFNLGVAMWYALVMTSAFGIVYTLVALSRRRVQQLPEVTNVHLFIRDEFVVGQRAPIGWGLLGALLLGFMANLEGVIDTGYQRGLLPSSFIKWIDIKDLTNAPPTGDWTGGFWWWWRASRVIHDLALPVNGQRGDVEVIDEFPFFSFLLGDLHPHVLALPFVLLAIVFCLNLLLGALSARAPADAGEGFRIRAGEWAGGLARATGLSWSGVVLYAVVFGGLAFLNTWDFPVYVGLAALAFGSGLAFVSGLNWRAIGGAIFSFAVLVAFGYILYTPFYIGFQSQLGGVLPNLLFPSRFSQFSVMFGPFLVIAVASLILFSREAGAARTARNSLFALAWTLLVPLLLVAVVVLGFLALPSGQAQVRDILQQSEIAANVPEQTVGGLLRLVTQVRVATPWTYLVLAALLAWAIGVVVTVLVSRRGRSGLASLSDDAVSEGDASPEAYRDPPIPAGRLPVDVFATLMIAIALSLTLFPEFLYLRDLFGTRMNTVFKFYYQAWALLALASAYGLSRLASNTTPRGLKIPTLAISAFLILGGLWYPVAAIPSKADNFKTRPSLNGLAYLQRSDPAQVAAIGWLRDNVRPDAVVLEATGGSYSDAARVSMATGNPTLLGWDFHERQWRGNQGYEKLASMRPGVIDQIYRSAQPSDLPGILNEWGVDYVYIGNAERAKYGVGDAALARFDASLEKIYDTDGVRIYAR